MCVIYEEALARFQSITLTGRLCYIFMCMERYLTGMYPGRDWTPVAEHMWQWTSQQYWDHSLQRYWEIVPDLVVYMDDLRETELIERIGCRRNKEPDRNDFAELTALFRGNPDDAADRAFCRTLTGDAGFCRILMMPVDFNNEAEGTSFRGAEPGVARLINELETILQNHQIALPDMSAMLHFEFDRSKPVALHEKDPGWGERENTEYLSVILHPEKRSI